MKAKTQFIKMYYKLPERARTRLVCDPYGKNPMTLNVVLFEVRNDTKLSKTLLKDLGFVDSEKEA